VAGGPWRSLRWTPGEVASGAWQVAACGVADPSVGGGEFNGSIRLGSRMSKELSTWPGLKVVVGPF
jgi:hypothetical protein